MYTHFCFQICALKAFPEPKSGELRETEELGNIDVLPPAQRTQNFTALVLQWWVPED